MRIVLLAAALALLAACGSEGGSSGALPKRSNSIGSAPAHVGSGPLGGFASLRAAAASVSRGCAETAGLGLPQLVAPDGPNSSIALWPRGHPPVVYAAGQYVTDRAGANVAAGAFSSRGLRMSLPHDALPIALWPCRKPVVFYLGNRGHLWMDSLAEKAGQQKSVSLGRILAPAVFDSRGRLVEIEGTRIHYLGGPTIALTGLPTPGWRIERLAPSPRQRSVFLAEVEKPGCRGNGKDTGRLYLISPSGNRMLATYDSCVKPPLAVWSQDGAKIFWTTYGRRPVVTRFHVSDSSDGESRTLTTVKREVGYALWSPDGTAIAYTSRGDLAQVAAVNVANGAVDALTHIRWKPTPPPRQPPHATVVGWSPNSKTVLILNAKPNGRRTTIEAVEAGGGRPRVLIRLAAR